MREHALVFRLGFGLNKAHQHRFLNLSSGSLTMLFFKMSPREILSLELLQHLNSISSTLIFYAVSTLIYYLYITRSRKYALLRSIPGPGLASITQLWVFNKTRGNQRQVVDLDLHRKYGSVVRVAPREVIFSSPPAFKKIYGEFFWFFHTKRSPLMFCQYQVL